MLNGFTSRSLSTQQQSILSKRRSHDQLIKGETFTSSSDNLGTSCLGETKSTDGHLGDGGGTDIVSDSSDNHGDLSILEETSDTRDGHAGSVDYQIRLCKIIYTLSLTSGHEQTLEDGLVKGRVGTAGEETIQLDEELQVRIGRLGRRSVLGDDLFRQIDTL